MSEKANLSSNNEYDGLSIQELGVKAKEIHEQWKNKYYEEDPLRMEIEPQVEKEYPYPIEIRKGDLNQEEKYPISFNSDQIIEVKAEKSETEGYVWLIRNKTLAENSKSLNKQEGGLQKGDVGDIVCFISEVNPNEIGTHKLKSILEEMKDPEGKEIYTFSTRENEISGVVLIKNYGNRSAYISILATHPKFQNTGVGRAILTNLKNRFDYLRVSAVPFGLTPGSTSDRLSKFYRQNGFVAGLWSKKTPSLNDINQAGDWQPMNENIWSIGNDQHILDKNFIIRTALQEMLKQDKIINSLSPEFVSKLKEWNKINNEKNRLEKENNYLHELIETKTRGY